MKTGSLIGFTEAELALILLVVFSIVLPARRRAEEAARPPQTIADSLRVAQDSLRRAQAQRDSILARLRQLEDSARRVAKANPGPEATGKLRSPADPACNLVPVHRGPQKPFGDVRIVPDGLEFEGIIMSTDVFSTRIHGFTDRAEALRCKYSMTVVLSPTTPSGRYEAFRRRFQSRYFVSARLED